MEKLENIEETKINIDGVDVRLPKEVVEKLKNDELDNGNPYNRTFKGEKYYSYGTYHIFDTHIEDGSEDAEDSFTVGNYCRSYSIEVNDVMLIMLNRLLKRFTCDNGWNHLYETSRKRTELNLFKIVFEFDTLKVVQEAPFFYEINTVYFLSADIANRAIQEVVKPFIEKHGNTDIYCFK